MDGQRDQQHAIKPQGKEGKSLPTATSSQKGGGVTDPADLGEVPERLLKQNRKREDH